ncbi:hypothetical protein [Sinomicrobium soli]|uniref:hypothetical protein n=1 Tax=Sinomicrobium sp. N-1-3-6 TaxID=2219864 RepID=UPI000DCB7F4B|nr:hypothetical protein [Sinomicrobium sp. N-1-3-6]RAV27412.1 hypothetical protein DN748_18785 [Sinomicrobium sp. N-1-3-6]
MTKYVLILFTILLAACRDIPKEVSEVLRSAKNNRSELKKVITHYKRVGDMEKLQAAYYLIANLKERYYWGGEAVTEYDSLFFYVDSLHQAGINIPPQSPLIKRKWKELVDVYGTPALDYAEKNMDKTSLSSAYLIAHIDQAFKVRETLSWGKQLTFEELCHYLLPYRIGTERPELWNHNVFDEYQGFRDKKKGEHRSEVAKRLFRHLKKNTVTNQALNHYPFDLPESLMRISRQGICKQLVYYNAMVMRGNGVPVDIDFIPLWGNRNGGHYWNVLLQEDGDRSWWYDAPKKMSFGSWVRPRLTMAKVYRKTFELQPEEPASNDIPSRLKDRNRIDVTAEYTQTFDVEIPLKYPSLTAKEYAVICTFNNRTWAVQAYGTIHRGHATFKQMGARVLYLAMYYHLGKLVPASDPFILKKDGTVTYISPEGLQDMNLLRKYPRFWRIEKFEKRLIGARFQGANHADFSDAVDLFTIENAPDSIGQALISSQKAFRYFRLLFHKEKLLNVGELKFYGINGDELKGEVTGFPEMKGFPDTPYQNAFDGDIGTYVHVPQKKDSIYSWVGLDVGSPKQLTKIQFAPRSDTNFILVGDTYELRYWDKDHWVSCGKQVAGKQKLLYRLVPANGLYLLHNLTRGKEERIFTYVDGKQVWW